jgi:hypothetical protein
MLMFHLVPYDSKRLWLLGTVCIGAETGETKNNDSIGSLSILIGEIKGLLAIVRRKTRSGLEL